MKISKGEVAKSKDKTFVRIGVDTLPDLPKDNTDRNRTSPFAFTGNKFEFRMVPSSGSISGPNVVLNTIVAESLDEIATRLEKCKDVNKEVAKIIKDVMKEHGRIIFNGDNYSENWAKEAAKRGLANTRSTVEALDALVTKKSETLFENYKVLTKEELHSRYEIYLETYAKQVNIEAKASIDMVQTLYVPAVIKYSSFLSKNIKNLKEVGVASDVQEKILSKITTLLTSAYDELQILKDDTKKAQAIKEIAEKSVFYRDKVFVSMKNLRKSIDELETIVAKEYWPVPSYADLTFRL
ncbi:MAG: hypothetical protein ACD_79C00423G0001 [uncultured bacterium]|nr:MAG: hypothetical protein ACD_79C00423G0001 [uncultured bacterium]